MHRGWLPVWAHLLDTAGIMELLLSEWAADPLGDRQHLSDPDWKKVCVFIALVHDIGKFTPLLFVPQGYFNIYIITYFVKKYKSILPLRTLLDF